MRIFLIVVAAIFFVQFVNIATGMALFAWLDDDTITCEISNCPQSS